MADAVLADALECAEPDGECGSCSSAAAEEAARSPGSPMERLRQAGLRPTRQRMALARLLLDGRCRHVSAEAVHAEALGADMKVSLATVYNTLNQFTAAGLLREVTIEHGRSHFDTNVSSHHHFLVEDTGELIDVPAAAVDVAALPPPPPGTSIRQVDVIIRVRGSGR